MRGADEVIGGTELDEALRAGKKLRVKVGFDPTAPDLHLGHTVVLTAMRRFQDAGHQVIFLVGDFTARIGDPSGRDRTRPTLSDAEIEANATTYAEQVSGLLRPEATEVRHNSEWLSPLSAEEFVRLAASQTLARMLERDDFSRRYKEEQPISLHEFLYPLVQGYDSVALDADIEMGGTDQKFNMLVGRDLQRQRGQRPQAVITWPLLEGTDGVRKMSKSLDNCIAIADSADEMFGKIMSITDELMWRYYQLLSLQPQDRIDGLRKGHPRDAKLGLAAEIVATYHGEAEAARARADFIARFSRKELPDDRDIEVVRLPLDDADMLLANVVSAAGMAQSASAARRLIVQGGLRLDGEVVERQDQRVGKGRYLVQAGRRRINYIELG